MTNKNYIGLLVIAFVVIVVLIGNIYINKADVAKESVTSKQTESVNKQNLVVSPLEYDLGKVLQSGGVISRVFNVSNNGTEQVVVTDVLASCSCTSATIDKKILAPGESTKLTVVFDPNFHYEDDGRFFRTVVIKSNSRGDAPEIKIWVEVDYDLGKDKLKFPPKTN